MWLHTAEVREWQGQWADSRPRLASRASQNTPPCRKPPPLLSWPLHRQEVSDTGRRGQVHSGRPWPRGTRDRPPAACGNVHGSTTHDSPAPETAGTRPAAGRMSWQHAPPGSTTQSQRAGAGGLPGRSAEQKTTPQENTGQLRRTEAAPNRLHPALARRTGCARETRALYGVHVAPNLNNISNSKGKACWEDG